MQRLRISQGALAELVIVTVGVLIALSVDTVREWRANDRLAAEARANILDEIRANKKRLDQLMPQLARHAKDYAAVHARLAGVLAGTPWGEGNMGLNYTAGGMTAAAYQTAEVTGAFRYMNYEEVRSYSGLYDLQAELVRLLDEHVERTSLLLGPAMLTSPDNLSRSDLEVVKRDLEQAYARLFLQMQTGRRLDQAYAGALKRAESGESDE